VKPWELMARLLAYQPPMIFFNDINVILIEFQVSDNERGSLSDLIKV
jgi:hypothetical protein